MSNKVLELKTRYESVQKRINSVSTIGMSQSQADSLMLDNMTELISVSTELGKLGYTLHNGTWYESAQDN